MNVGILLSFKESLRILSSVGQEGRFVDYYVDTYAKNFDTVFIFSWEKEVYKFTQLNAVLIPNRYNLNKYLYVLLLPLIEWRTFKKISVLRLTQFTAIIPAIIAKKFFGIKIIATYGFPYGSFLKVKGRFLKYRIWNTLEKFLITKTDHFIVTYQTMYDYLVEKGSDPESIHIIPNSVDLDVFKPVYHKEGGVKPVVIYVGRMEKEKNISGLSDAAYLIKDKVTFIFVGKGSLLEGFITRCDSDGINYKYLDSVPNSEIAKLFNTADIFILPSFAEGYPKVLIEAMACGLPSVVTKYPGYESVVTEGVNALVSTFEPVDIADKVLKLLDPRLRAEIGKNAREYVEHNNNIRINLNKEINLIKTCATS